MEVEKISIQSEISRISNNIAAQKLKVERYQNKKNSENLQSAVMEIPASQYAAGDGIVIQDDIISVDTPFKAS